MFGLIFMMYFVGAVPMYYLIDKKHKKKQKEKYHERMTGYIEEQADPKYNLPRQKEVIDMINDMSYRDKVDDILGDGKMMEMIMKYRYADIRTLHYAVIKSIAEKEGWEVYYHPFLKYNIYYYGAHVDIEDLI